MIKVFDDEGFIKEIDKGKCPHCGKEKIDRTVDCFANSIDSRYITVNCYCNECKIEFTEYYELDEIKI